MYKNLIGLTNYFELPKNYVVQKNGEEGYSLFCNLQRIASGTKQEMEELKKLEELKNGN